MQMRVLQNWKKNIRNKEFNSDNEGLEDFYNKFANVIIQILIMLSIGILVKSRMNSPRNVMILVKLTSN